MVELHGASKRLRQLGAEGPTPEGWNEVRRALHSKWEGLQACGCRTLSDWGGREAVSELRSFLSAACRRGAGPAVLRAAIHSLVRCVTAEDAAWVLDEVFTTPGIMEQRELLPLVRALPLESARERLVAESHSADRNSRELAMKAFAGMEYPEPERRAFLVRMAEDFDPEIRRGARWMASILPRLDDLP
jgi:hypothetical protein